MGAIRASGLASGLDTNAIVDQLVTAAKEPINQLNIRLQKIGLTKTLYNDINSDISGMRNVLLNLKLASTFTSKTTNISNSSVLSARASTSAATGSYTVNVLQTAKNATTSSQYTRARLAAQGAGVIGVEGIPGKYNQLEGLHKVSVKDNGGEWTAESVFTPSDKGLMTEQKGSAITGLNPDGTFAAALEGTIEFTINQDGQPPRTVEVNIDAYANESIHTVLANMEQSLNEELNNEFGTTGVQYAALRGQYTTPGQWNIGLYNVSDEKFTLSAADAATSLNPVVATLGIDSLPGTATSVSTIVKHYADDSSADLDSQLSNTLTGIVHNQSVIIDGGLTEGTFTIAQDASSNIRMATKTKLEGTPLTIFAAAPGYTVTDRFGAGASSFNGTFTINNTKITIEDAENKSINDIIAIVNASGAGVTMSYDRTTEIFTLTSNNTGAATINVSEGTSDLLSTFNLTADKGAVKTLGTTNGTLDTAAIISTAGFSSAVNSGVFTVNGVPIYVDASKDSVDDVLAKVNKSAANVTMSYDSVQDKFVIMSKTTEPIRLGSATDTSNFLGSTGLVHASEVNMEKTHGTAGQNAIIEVGGRTYQRETNTIEDVITGVSINVLSVGVSTIEVDVNTGSAVDALAGFIKSYNEMLTKLNPAEITRDEREDKMDPLTEADKEDMSDEDIKKYQEEYDRLHTTDIMSKQHELKQLKDSMRRNIMDIIPSSSSTMFNNLSELGIKIAGEGNIEVSRFGFLMTTSTDLDEIKKAITDNTTLMNNLRNNPEEVYRFFGDYTETVDDNGKITVHQDSWARRYERMLINMQDVNGPIGGKVKVDGGLDRQISQLQDQIDRKTLSTEKYLERLWSQFTAMETRIAQINSQAQYLSSLAPAAAAGGGK